MNTLTVNYGGARITVRRATVLDNLNRMRLAKKCIEWVADDELLDNLVWKWVTITTRTVTLENVDYALPSVANSEDELKASFDAFTSLDAALVDVWANGAVNANEPLNDAKFAPMGEPVPNS